MGKPMGSIVLVQYFVDLNLFKSVNLLHTYTLLQNSISETGDHH